MPWVRIETIVAKNTPALKEVQQVNDYVARGAKARFYADENFAARAVRLLRQTGANVQTAREAGLIRHPDENHLAYARRKGLIFITCDRDFLDERRFPLVHCPAIFVFDFGTGSVQDMRKSFRCLETVFRAPQFFDKWSKIDAKPNGWIELVRHQDGSTSRLKRRVSEGVLYEWVDD